MEQRVENPELKPYVEKIILGALENCELFVKTFGKGYATERLGYNFQTLYTDALNDNAAGEFTLGLGRAITLFAKGKDGKLLTSQDIDDFYGLKSTIVHEGIHAVFNKTPEECAPLGIKYGSGIHECYPKGASIFKELGRGLNEGYTNWVCEKAGFSTGSSYHTLTNFVRLLEIAIGPENVMQFGYGDIYDRIAPLLGMDFDECCDFLTKTDNLCNYDYKMHDYGIVASRLERILELEKHLADNPGAEIPEELTNLREKVSKSQIYIDVSNDPMYLSYAQENNFDPNLDETKQSYFTYMRDNYSKNSKELKQEIEANLFSKYFIQELEEIKRTGRFSFEQYRKYASLDALIESSLETENETLKTFKEYFEEMKTSFFDFVQEELQTSLENGTFSPEQLSQYVGVISKRDYNGQHKIKQILGEALLPENPEAYITLFDKLVHESRLSEINNYKILELNTANGEKANLFFDMQGSKHFSRSYSRPVTVSASDEITEDNTSLFDITLADLQSMQEIVKSFIKLKEEISQQSPNAKFNIIDNVIVLTRENEEPTYYLLQGNDIVSANANEMVPVNQKMIDGLDNKVVEEKPLEIKIKENMDKSATITLPKDENQLKEGLPQKLKKNPAEQLGLESVEELENKNNSQKYLIEAPKNPLKRFFWELRRKFFQRAPTVAPAMNELDKKATETLKERKNNFEEWIHVDKQPTLEKTSIPKKEPELDKENTR